MKFILSAPHRLIPNVWDAKKDYRAQWRISQPAARTLLPRYPLKLCLFYLCIFTPNRKKNGNVHRAGGICHSKKIFAQTKRRCRVVLTTLSLTITCVCVCVCVPAVCVVCHIYTILPATFNMCLFGLPTYLPLCANFPLLRKSERVGVPRARF